MCARFDEKKVCSRFDDCISYRVIKNEPNPSVYANVGKWMLKTNGRVNQTPLSLLLI